MSSPYLNTYTPPPPSNPLPNLPHLETPITAYDLNFNSPIPHPPLSTDRVTLIPFIPALHARQLNKEMRGERGVMRLMPYPKNMGGGLQELLEGVEGSMRSLSDRLLFAIFDLTKTSTCTPEEEEAPGRTHDLPVDHPPVGCMAGIIAIFCDRVNLTGELGHIIIFPKSQRTHVLSHAAGLLMHYALDFPHISTYDPVSKTSIPPSSSTATQQQKALGLRRLQWQAHITNTASIRSARRLGFEEEGVVRMHGTANGGDEPGREGDGAGMSRSNWVGSITWRDWEERVKGVVDGLVAR